MMIVTNADKRQQALPVGNRRPRGKIDHLKLPGRATSVIVPDRFSQSQ
ncbi:hypothetical protein [Sodalis sp.]